MRLKSAALVLAGALGGSMLVFAAMPKTYQFTGTVKEMGNDTFSVDNGKEVWSFGLNGDSQGKEGLKVGQKVTITYRMFATKIESKAGDAQKAATKVPDKTDVTKTDASKKPGKKP